MPRVDRILTLYCFTPLRRLGLAKELAIPILMYHSISDSDEKTVHPYYRICTSPRTFAKQMSWLHEHGYTTLSLEHAMDLLSEEKSISIGSINEKYVVITFDDGFKDLYTNAFPILDQYNFTATAFLPTSFIHDSNTTIIDKTFLSWPQIRELIRAGITFGSHTVSHNYLAQLTRAQREQELQKSKEIIEDRTGSTVRTFSFPYAFPEHDKGFVAFMRETLQACGYAGAVTTCIGTAAKGDDLLFLKRIPINSDDDPLLLQAKMIGGYNWMHALQYASKSVRTMLSLDRRKNSAKWASH